MAYYGNVRCDNIIYYKITRFDITAYYVKCGIILLQEET